MSLTFEVNGSDALPYLRDGNCTVDKYYGVEVLTATLVDRDNVSGAFQVNEGDDIYLADDGGVVFGGTVISSERTSVVDDTGMQSRVVAHDYGTEAREVVVSYLRVPSQDVLVTASNLFDAYLAPRGFTNIGSTSGGPTIDAFVVEKTSLADVLALMQELSGYVPRINGDREFAMAEPGGISGPVTLSVANGNIRQGDAFQVVDERVERATRLFIQTGTPATGAGPVDHTELRTANGTHTVFPLNVEPGVKVAAVNALAGYSSSATAMALDGAYQDRTLLGGDTFHIDGQATLYTVAAPATSDADGAFATVTFSPGLSADVIDNQGVIFAPSAFVRLEVNGTPTALYGGQWSYDAEAHAFVKTSGAPTSGTTIEYQSPIAYPAWTRVWDSSVVASSGAIDTTATVDATIQRHDQTDFVLATAWGREEVGRLANLPTRVRLTTEEKGFYPMQEATIQVADRGVNGVHLVERVRARVIDQFRVEYDLECVEGDTLGRAWFEFLRGQRSGGGGGVAASGGASGGGGSSSVLGVSRIPLGGDNFRGDNLTSWEDVPNATPIKFGGPSTAGIWALRVYRRVKETTSPATTIEIRLRDVTNSVTLATASTTSSTTFAGEVLTFTSPAVEGVVLLQSRMARASGTPAEGIVGQCSLEKG